MVSQLRKAMHWKGTIGLLLLMGAAIILAGCGKKGPPTVPRQIPLPVVADLGAAVTGDTVTLTWTLAPPAGAGAPELAGFFVNRSKTRLADADCIDCPVLFERVADLPMEAAAAAEGAAPETPQYVYTETLEKGYRYIYTVTVYTPREATGPESNRAELIH